MALQAYPDVPLFRYPYTELSEARIADQLRAPATGGPGSASRLETDLAGTVLRFVNEDGGTLNWRFGQENRVTFENVEAGYGALTLDHVVLIAHLIPGTARGYAIAWDRDSNLATVFELWFGNGPAPQPREVNRAIWHGYIADGDNPPPETRHRPTLRLEGRALRWTEDTGNRTLDYYPSVAYSHWVELDRLKEGRGYSAPSDYIQLTEDIYAYTRTESEFSGLWHMYLMDMNRLEQVGLRLGFNGADEVEFYMFRGTGEWLGQIARFEAFGETEAEPLKVENGQKGERRVYRPLETMDKMTPAEVNAVVAENTHVFDRPSPMAGNGTPPTDHLAGKAFAIRYDGGPLMEYRFTSDDSLQWRRDGGGWTTARYQAWESMPACSSSVICCKACPTMTGISWWPIWNAAWPRPFAAISTPPISPMRRGRTPGSAELRATVFPTPAATGTNGRATCWAAPSPGNIRPASPPCISIPRPIPYRGSSSRPAAMAARNGAAAAISSRSATSSISRAGRRKPAMARWAPS